MPFVRLAFVQWHSFTPLCSPTMRYPWRSRTSCFSGSISSRHDGAGLKGFRGASFHEVDAGGRRGPQGEQLDVSRHERHGVERTALRFNRLEAIEFGREHEVPDLVRPAVVLKWCRHVRCEDRFDPGPVNARNAPENPGRIVVHELRELIEGHRFDPSKVARAERGAKSELIDSKRAIEDPRRAYRQVQQDKR